MIRDFSELENGSGTWRLALTLAGDTRHATGTRVGTRELIVLPLAGEGWWAVDAACTGCGARLPLPAMPPPVEQLACDACGHVHVPDCEGASGPPVMVVDDEVYVHCE